MKKILILAKFTFKWLLPRAALLVPFVWLAISTLEIMLADPAQAGHAFWQYNIWVLLLG